MFVEALLLGFVARRPRERDRLRQGIIGNLGWQFHRICSTDWFHPRQREIDRLKATLDRARGQIETGVRMDSANQPGPRPMPEPPPEPEPDGPIPPPPPRMRAYVRAQIAVRSRVEPHEAPVAQLADLVTKIVAFEDPIHIDEVARRIATAFGRSRPGSRIADATARAVGLALQRNAGSREDGTLLLIVAQSDAPRVLNRSPETGNVPKTTYLPRRAPITST
jgi:hypothetical protein